MSADAFLERVKFDDRGLVTVVTQDADSGDVLMVAYMNRESLERTIQDGTVCYYSRSRQTLWVKGATSGHLQHVRELCIDCDGDALLVKVDQTGGACHEGYRSCFFRRRADDGGLVVVMEKLFEKH